MLCRKSVIKILRHNVKDNKKSVTFVASKQKSFAKDVKVEYYLLL